MTLERVAVLGYASPLRNDNAISQARSSIVSYQVIARKYRPQTFADLTGQEHITRTLSHALDGQRLHHAYLFSGVRGTGKTTSARILAKGLNCHSGVTSKPCLQCPSCLEISAGNSLDVLEIDAASNTGVDNVRDVIINNIALAPARDRYKVFVIDEVHMLSTSAFNALLKTLEEPPAHVVFIMATTELHKVPDTILSRCQQFEFRQIPTEKIFQRLREIAQAEGIQINEAALREIARAGAGSLRDAQSAFDQVIAFSGAEISETDVSASLGLVSAATLGQFAETIVTQDTSRMLTLVEEVAARGYDLRNFTRELMAYLRHVLVVKSGISSGEMLGVADVEIERLKQLAAQFSEEDLVRCFHLLAVTEKEIKDSPHPRFQLELGLVKLAHATRLRTLHELIERLEALSPQSGGTLSGASVPPHPPTTPRPLSGNTPDNMSSPKPTEPRVAAAVERALARAEEAPPAPPVNQPTPAPVPATVSAPSAAADFDVPEFDESEPVDLPEIDLEPSLPMSKRTSAPPTPTAPSFAAHVAPGQEVNAILREVQKLNRLLIQTALEDAQQLSYQQGILVVTFAAENMFAKRVRDSSTLFREIGERLFGQPLRVDVRISGQAVEKRVDEAEEKRKQLREQAMQNPAVKLTLEELRGEIVSVREASDALQAPAGK